MDPALDAHHWLARFAVRLMALQPELSFRAAVARAAAAHAHAKALAPEDAAQIDADVRRTEPTASDASAEAMWAETSWLDAPANLRQK